MTTVASSPARISTARSTRHRDGGHRAPSRLVRLPRVPLLLRHRDEAGYGTPHGRKVGRRPGHLRDCDWQSSPLGNLLAVPKDGLPISRWPHPDEAFLDVVRQIRRLLEARNEKTAPHHDMRCCPGGGNRPCPGFDAPLKQPQAQEIFSEADKDAFREETFDFMGSLLRSLARRTAARKNRHRRPLPRVDLSTLHRRRLSHGKAVARCTIRLGGAFGDGISYSMGDNADANSINENLSVEAGDHELHLKPLGLASFGSTATRP